MPATVFAASAVEVAETPDPDCTVDMRLPNRSPLAAMPQQLCSITPLSAIKKVLCSRVHAGFRPLAP
jgi:hypothetical protein